MKFEKKDDLMVITFPITCGKVKGSGFLTSSGLILTARHVIIEHLLAQTPIKLQYSGAELTAEFVDEDKDIDAALLKLDPSPLVSEINLLNSPIIVGDNWHAFGFPDSGTPRHTGDTETGTIRRGHIKSDVTIFDMELACDNYYPGMAYEGYSGSPVMMPQGVIIGMLIKKLNKGLGAVSIQKLGNFLEKHNVAFETDYERYNNHDFGANWFRKHAEKIIDDAGPRYSPKVNVRLDVEQYLDATTADERFFVKLRRTLSSLNSNIDSLKGFMPAGAGYSATLTAISEIVIKLAQLNTAPGIKIDRGDLGTSIDGWRNVLEAAQRDVRQGLYTTPPAGGTTPNRNRLESELYNLNRVIDELDELAGFVDSPFTRLFNQPYLLLTGIAGQGKTHLLADITIRRIEEGSPSLMFFGHHFSSGDPWAQMIVRLELQLTKTEFLEKLNELGAERKKRVLISIDALNEGAGRTLWYDAIRTILADLAAYPWVVLAVSIRTPFEEIIIPTDLLGDQGLINIVHQGFKGFEFEAVKTYFNFYQIELQSIPLLDPEFSNPLFLKVFCQGLSDKKQRRLPKGWQKFNAVFQNYLDQKNLLISATIDADPKQHMVLKAMRALAKELLYTNQRNMSRERANEICEQVRLSNGWSKSLLNQLISEGLLLDSVAVQKDSWTDTIEFGYERFGDFLKADYLSGYFEELAKYRDQSPFKEIFENGWLVAQSNLVDALSILIPEKFGRELYEFLPELAKDYTIANSFLNSLAWRSYNSIQVDKTLAYIDQVLPTAENLYERLLNTLLLVGSDPHHPFNGDYLHAYLMSFESMGERDQLWTMVLHNWYRHRNDEYHAAEKTLIDSYIQWAWSQDSKIYIDDPSMLLAATVMGWLLTSSNRFLRDDTTKAMIGLLKDRSEVVIALLKKFEQVNDPYVAERLYAVAYGVVLASNELPVIESIACFIYTTIFKDGAPPVNILLRDHARGCIERAYYLKPELAVDMTLVRPPYYSQWVTPPSLAEAEQYDVERAGEQYTRPELGQARLYSSVMGFEDFARYVIGTNSSSEWTDLPMRGDRYAKLLKQSVQGEARKKLGDVKILKELLATIKTYAKLRPGTMLAKPSMMEGLPEKLEEQKRGLLPLLDAEQQRLLEEEFIPHFQFAAVRKAFEKNRLEKFDLSRLQRLIIKKVFDLGWTKEKFGEFDRDISVKDGGRHANKEERIGKKYQWIGYHEYLARIADNFYYNGSSLYGLAIPYEGPFQGSRERDIDPSISIKKQLEKPSILLDGVFSKDIYRIDRDVTHPQWVRSADNLPDVKQLVQPLDHSGERWLMLEAMLDWSEDLQVEDNNFAKPKKQLWYQLRSYLVKKNKKDTFLKWAKKQDFWGRWMPESHDQYDYYLRESYWSPAYLLSRKDNGYRDWINPSQSGRKGGTVNCTISPTCESHLCEAGTFDCSIEKTIQTMLPSRLIAEKMKLSFGQRDGYLFNPAGELAALDPSLYDNGPNSLIVNQKLFLQFLEENELEIVWTLMGEKRILGHDNRDYTSLRINGIFELDEDLKLQETISTQITS